MKFTKKINGYFRKYKKCECDECLVAEEFLELNHASLVDGPSGAGGLRQVVPASNVCVLAEIKFSNFEGADSGQQRDVRNSQVVTSNVLALLQESVQEPEGFFNLLELLGISRSLSKELGVVVVGESLIQSSHVEVEALVDNSASLDVLWIQRVILAVLFDQISEYSTTFPQSKAVIVQCWNTVLRVDLRC